MWIRFFAGMILLLGWGGVRAQLTYSPAMPTTEDRLLVTYQLREGETGWNALPDRVITHLRWVNEEKRGNWQQLATAVDDNTLQCYADLPELTGPAADLLEVRFSGPGGSEWLITATGEPLLIPLNVYSPDSLEAFEKKGDRVLLYTRKGQYRLTFYNEAVVRVEFENEAFPNADTSHAIAVRPKGVNIQVQEKEMAVHAIADGLEVRVQKKPLRLSFFRDQELLLQEEKGFYARPGSAGFRFELPRDEAIWGTGARSIEMNRQGERIELYNQPHYGYGEGAPNLNYSVPAYLSSKGYMLLFDNPQKGYMDFGALENGVTELGTMGGDMDYVLIAGDDYADNLYEYTWLTGRQPLPPIWALGNLQSRFGYETQEQAEQVVNDMLAAGYPLDALIIDLFWFGDGDHDQFFMGDLSWKKDRWPEPEQMIANFRYKGVKTVLITEPYILEESKNFDFTSNNGLLGKNEAGETFVIDNFYFGDGGLLDIFNPRTRQWFWKQYQRQIEKGIAGWWGDLGEPETHPSGIRYTAGPADAVHNIYAHNWHQMLYRAYQKHYPNQRLFNLNRSGFAGSQRFSIFPWSGDVARSWSGFRAQMPIMLGMGLSGLGYMHSDLGGFAMGTKDEELFTRWLQMGTFNPVFRPHGHGIPSEPIYYSDSTQAVIKRYIQLRYRMLPYNYTLAWENATQGLPLARPLFFEEPDNSRLYNQANSYMWGSQILVAPVMHKHATSREIYLPEGRWYDFHTRKPLSGGLTFNQQVTFENIPLFVKAGTFMPLVHPLQTTDHYVLDTLEVQYFPVAEGEASDFVLYNDDGTTPHAFENGEYELISFRSAHVDKELRISVVRSGEDYEGKQEQVLLTFRMPLQLYGGDLPTWLDMDKLYVNDKRIRQPLFDQKISPEHYIIEDKELVWQAWLTNEPLEIRITKN